MIDDGLQHGMEGCKLRVLAAVGHMLFAAHRHGERRTVHDELLTSSVGRDADVVRLTYGERACCHSILRQCGTVLRARHILCCAK